MTKDFDKRHDNAKGIFYWLGVCLAVWVVVGLMAFVAVRTGTIRKIETPPYSSNN